MLAQLGPKRALDQRLFQLFEQPVLSGQVLRLRVVRKQFVQKFGGNRRISRHVSLPLKVNSQKPTYTLFLTPSSRTLLARKAVLSSFNNAVPPYPYNTTVSCFAARVIPV